MMGWDGGGMGPFGSLRMGFVLADPAWADRVAGCPVAVRQQRPDSLLWATTRATGGNTVVRGLLLVGLW